MKLTAFSVEKFRSIILPSSFSVYNKTVLLGPNNEGKSNVLRALVFALEFIKEFAFHNSKERRLLVLSCGGTSHMENFVSFLRNQLCNIYIFVDDDSAGNQLIDRMKNNGSIQDSEYTILKMNGLGNSEIENIFKPDIYASIISQKYGIAEELIISCCSAEKKWSTSMEWVFRESGKSWNDDTKNELKTLVSEAVKSCAELQLIEHRKHALVAGCSFLEQYFKG